MKSFWPYPWFQERKPKKKSLPGETSRQPSKLTSNRQAGPFRELLRTISAKISQKCSTFPSKMKPKERVSSNLRIRILGVSQRGNYEFFGHSFSSIFRDQKSCFKNKKLTKTEWAKKKWNYRGDDYNTHYSIIWVCHSLAHRPLWHPSLKNLGMFLKNSEKRDFYGGGKGAPLTSKTPITPLSVRASDHF